MKKSTKVIIIVSVVILFLIAAITAVSVVSHFILKPQANLSTSELSEYVTEYTENNHKDSLAENTTDLSSIQSQTEVSKENADYLSSLSDNDIKMLNIFLSNFSEAFVEDIDTNNMAKMIDFVCLNTEINYYDKIVSSEQIQNTDNGQYYQDYLTEEYVRERINRFFDVELENMSTDLHYYNDGKYYFIMADGETYAHFTKITSAKENTDGTVTVNYDVYWYNTEYNTPPKSIYEGIGSQNLDSLCQYRYSGVAVVKPVQLGGDSYSNYKLISLERK